MTRQSTWPSDKSRTDPAPVHVSSRTRVMRRIKPPEVGHLEWSQLIDWFLLASNELWKQSNPSFHGKEHFLMLVNRLTSLKIRLMEEIFVRPRQHVHWNWLKVQCFGQGNQGVRILVPPDVQPVKKLWDMREAWVPWITTGSSAGTGYFLICMPK